MPRGRLRFGTGSVLPTSNDVTSRSLRLTTSMVAHLACLEGLVLIDPRSWRVTTLSTAFATRSGETGSLTLTTTTSSHGGSSVTNGRLGSSTSQSAKLRQHWKTASSSYISAPDGLAAIGEAIGQASSRNVMCGRKFHGHWPLLTSSLTSDYSQQPWCTYALHFATFTSLAFLVDPLLLASLWWATAEWDPEARNTAFWAQFIFMFAFTKVVKLIGLFRRNPSDLKYLVVSIVFGYFHGLIKLYALLTLNMVCLPHLRTCSSSGFDHCLLTKNADFLGQPTRW